MSDMWLKSHAIFIQHLVFLIELNHTLVGLISTFGGMYLSEVAQAELLF
jgi:hypothetical protein